LFDTSFGPKGAARAGFGPRSQLRIFALTWLSYFSYYQTRKNLSFAKTEIEKQKLADLSSFAWMETAYLTAYAVGMFTFGLLSEKISPKKMVAAGMLASAILSVVFGATDLVVVMAVAFGLNGLVQATGWPGNARITASWFAPAERGVVMGWWGTCYQVGPIVAGLVSPFLLRFGWRWSLFGPALWVALVALAFYLWVDDKPETAPAVATETAAAAPKRPLHTVLLANPAVWMLGASYFAIKLTRYALWFWLPYYFERSHGFSREDSTYLALYFDYGGVAGVVLSGYVADKILRKRRIATAALFLAVQAVVLGLYAWHGSGHAVALTAVGALLFGADSLISSTAAQDTGGPDAAGAAAGFVNGMGSIGAILQGALIAVVARHFGWQALFYCFVVLAAMGALVLCPLLATKVSDRPGSNP
jgi:sugar phosphate permease